MVDAAEILRRKGHSPAEISRLASELGRALKTAWEATHPEAVATNVHEFGAGSNDVRMYNTHSDAAFMDATVSFRGATSTSASAQSAKASGTTPHSAWRLPCKTAGASHGRGPGGG